jgi:hypothetical protein
MHTTQQTALAAEDISFSFQRLQRRTAVRAATSKHRNSLSFFFYAANRIH